MVYIEHVYARGFACSYPINSRYVCRCEIAFAGGLPWQIAETSCAIIYSTLSDADTDA